MTVGTKFQIALLGNRNAYVFKFASISITLANALDLLQYYSNLHVVEIIT